MVATGSLETNQLILTAFGLMPGLLKPADVSRCIGVILGLIVAPMLVSAFPANAIVDGVSMATNRPCWDCTRRQVVAAIKVSAMNTPSRTLVVAIFCPA